MIGALLILNLCSCDSRDDDYDYYDYDDYYDDDYWADREEENVKNSATAALIRALEAGYTIGTVGKPTRLNLEIDAGQCSIYIVSITGDSSSGWTVKGTVTPRDEFGNLCEAILHSYDYSLNFIIEVPYPYWGECVYLYID